MFFHCIPTRAVWRFCGEGAAACQLWTVAPAGPWSLGLPVISPACDGFLADEQSAQTPGLCCSFPWVRVCRGHVQWATLPGSVRRVPRPFPTPMPWGLLSGLSLCSSMLWFRFWSYITKLLVPTEECVTDIESRWAEACRGLGGAS